MPKKKAEPAPAPSTVEELAKVHKETSSSARFSTYERWSNPDPWDADLILEHRGEPDKKVKPVA